MNIAYLIYQAERPRSAAERRYEDTSRGEFAKSLSRVLHARGHLTPASPALKLIRGTVASSGPASCVPAKRDNRAAC